MDILLQQWEEQFKKGQLTLWILLSLLEQDRSVEEIAEFTADISGGHYTFDAQSIYRAMRNFTSLGLVTSISQSSNKGPDKKIFSITALGKNLLKEFYPRNLQIFNSTQFNSLINKLNEK